MKFLARRSLSILLAFTLAFTMTGAITGTVKASTELLDETTKPDYSGSKEVIIEVARSGGRQMWDLSSLFDGLENPSFPKGVTAPFFLCSQK